MRILRRDVLGVRLGVLVLVLPVVCASMARTVSTRGIWNHPPDSRYYLTMMSRDLGHSVTASINRTLDVANWQVASWYFEAGEHTWELVKNRGLYPVLSMPFVWAMGLRWGSLAVPLLSVVAFCWITARTLQRLYGPAVAAFVVGAFSLTGTIGYLIWATTDTLAMALAAVIVANLPIERPACRANLVWLGAATVFIALTRQVGVLAPAMAGAGWLWAAVRERHWRNRWLAAFVVTVVATVLVQLASMVFASVDTKAILTRGESTFGGVAWQFWNGVGTVTHEALSYMWAQDRVLLALLVAAGAMTLLQFTRDLAAVFVGAAAATYLLTAGVGFSTNMRYEVIMFPAAAVAAGALVAAALGERSAGGEAMAAAATGIFEAGTLEAGTSETEAFDVSVDSPTPNPTGRWIPQLVGCATVLTLVLAITAVGGSRSTGAAPPSPSDAAARSGQPDAVRPLATPPAETTLSAALTKAASVARGSGILEGPFDPVHQIRYRPTAADQPGWTDRVADGTAVVRVNAMSGIEPMAFSQAVSLGATVLPDTVAIGTRRTSAYGEDVDFTVRDAGGVLHHGTATTLYPIWDANDPGLVTSLVYAP